MIHSIAWRLKIIECWQKLENHIVGSVSEKPHSPPGTSGRSKKGNRAYGKPKSVNLGFVSNTDAIKVHKSFKRWTAGSASRLGTKRERMSQ